MGISAVALEDRVGQIKYALATLLVFLGVFYYLYGPPLTHMFRAAAADRCNELTGSNYRTFRLSWQTTTYHSIDIPHWECWNTAEPTEPAIDLGWWVAP